MRYRSKLSGPLMDRIDLQLAVPRLPPQDLRPDAPRGETSATVRERVLAARDTQLARAGRLNAHLSQAQTEDHCRLAANDQALLENAMATLQLSARAMHRILRVARSIADLAGRREIATAHLAEAIGYRVLDRSGAG
jgi:magnesium chelatase family protein